MNIRMANISDHAFIAENDHHINPMELKNVIALKRIIIAEDEEKNPIGWLRYNLFWDNTPFMNMLFLFEEYRGKGYGAALLSFWETEMLQDGYFRVMLSTAADERAQHFYQKYQYVAVGGFMPWDDPYELIFLKELSH